MLDEVLDMISPGGLYIVDDMIPQENWPDGHHQKAIKFVDYLDAVKQEFLVHNWNAKHLFLSRKNKKINKLFSTIIIMC